MNELKSKAQVTHYTISKSTIAKLCILIVLAVFLNICGCELSAQINANYPLTGNSETGLILGAGAASAPSAPARLTGTGGGSGNQNTATYNDAIGSGWLRLTNAATFQGGYAFIDIPFPSDRGIIFEFDYNVWGSLSIDAADGLSVFLFDGATTAAQFSLGYLGGGLGYSAIDVATVAGVGTDRAGLFNGYLGIGFDELGNFARKQTVLDHLAVNCTPGLCQNISIRGNSVDKTPYLTGAFFPKGTLNYTPVTTSRPASSTHYRRVQVALVFDGTHYKVNVNMQSSLTGAMVPMVSSYIVTKAPPATLKIGFAAATGASNAIHEVRNLKVRTPGLIRVNKRGPGGIANGSAVTYTVDVYNDSEHDLSGISFTDLLPAGFTLYQGQPTIESPSADGTLTGGALVNGKYTAQLAIKGLKKMTLSFTGKVDVVAPISNITNTAIAKVHPDFSDNDVTNDTARVTSMIISPPDNIKKAKCYITPPKGEWSIKQRFMSEGIAGPISGDVFEMSIPLVGDIDNDGVVEIVCAGKSVVQAATLFSCNSIKIFDALNKTVKYEFPVERFHGGFGTIAMADVDRDGFAEIFVATDGNAPLANRGYIYCYSHTGVEKWKSKAVYTTSVTSRAFPYLNLVDFNGDGIPEIMANDRIFNAKTGDLLLDCNLIATGKDYGTGGGHQALDIAIPAASLGAFSATGDIDGDGLPELIAGRNIYKITIVDTNPINTDPSHIANNTCSLLRSVISGTRTELGDGYTTIADIDLDGTLDVVVVRQPSLGSTIRYLFAWSGKTGALLHTNRITANGGLALGAGSIPFIGDLDGDGVPEIAFTGPEMLYAYKYNKTAQTLDPLWPAHLGGLPTEDRSCATTLSLFDFDQDGAMELIYRDEDNLRIIDGKTATNKYTVVCNSWTMNEYPVIADVTGDGRANIVVLGKPVYGGHGNGFLYVFEADLSIGTPWAPARSVWNQWAYNAVNVNDDLTIPKYQFSTTTVFPGEDGILGNDDDVRPYNGFLMQQTRLDINGTPLFTAPNAEIRKQPSFVYNVAKDSMTVTVTVHNAGDAAFQNPFKITAYKNAVGGTPKLTHSYAEVINAGDSAVITFGIPKFKAEWTQPTFTGLFFRVNDKGNGYADQSVCDSSKRDFKTGLVIASDDRVLVFQNTGNVLNILKNDIYPASCTPTIDILLPLAKHGIYNKTTDTYTPNTDYLGPDTIRYKITCGAESSEAMVVISVVPKPDNIDGADCFIEPSKGVWSIKESKVHNQSVVLNFAPIYVGDLNNDNNPEIVTLSSGNQMGADGDGKYSEMIFVYMGPDHTNLKKITPTAWVNLWGGGGIALLKTKISGKDTALIVTQESDNKLRAYNIHGIRVWETPIVNRLAINTLYFNVGIADFNNDGIPEIYCGPDIFNSQDGQRICTLPSNSNLGLASAWATSNGGGTTVVNRKVSSPIVADIDGDATLEYIVGSEVYKINITTGSVDLLQTITPPKDIIDNTTIMPKDGKTSVVDLDLDGYLDIVVSGTYHDNSTYARAFVWVWSPHKNKILARTCVAGARNQSIPFVGDIDGDGKPEILFINSIQNTNAPTPTSDFLWAFKYDGTETLSQCWKISHSDRSGNTGITLFDFNQDGISEIVFRDKSHLRIINGSKKSHITGNDTIIYNLASFSCYSNTASEYPVVADINNDGHAEIVVNGPATSGPFLYANGPLRIFEAGSGIQWAPARPVWNQYAYNAVNVNNDLTIPKYQLNPATVFPGKDGVLGTADDVRPYNAFLQQQTTLNSHGTSLFLAPNAEIRKQPSFVYDPLRDSMTVSVTVHNAGDAAFSNPFKITAYKNDVGETPNHTHSYAGVINAGDSAVITFGIPRFKAEWMQTPFTGLFFRVNDKGNGYADQAVCDSSKRDFKTGALIASDDRALVFQNSTGNAISILKNDIYPAACTPTIGAPLVQNPKYGSVAIVAGVINYTPTLDYLGLDTIRYKITCSGESSEAMVVINVIPQPDNIGGADCYIDPPKGVWSIEKLDSIGYGTVNTLSAPIVGDIDNDGEVEMIVHNNGSVDPYQTYDKLLIFSVDKTTKKLKSKYSITLQANSGSLVGQNIAIANIDGNGYSAIFIATAAGNLDKYAYNTSSKQFELKWSKVYSKNTKYQRGGVTITDIMGDGNVQVCVQDKIFDAKTGTLLANGGWISNTTIGNTAVTYSFGLFGLPMTNGETEYGKQSIMIAVDIDGDGIKELIGGNMVYKVNISNYNQATAPTGNTFTLYKKSTRGLDGGATIADVNNDGKIDVIVTARTADGSGVAHDDSNQKNDKGAMLYVYDPLTGQVLHTNTPLFQRRIYYGPSLPFAGDIDGDGYTEIALTSLNVLKAFKLEDDQLKEIGSKDIVDGSAATTLTLFDFTQSDTAMLVYRDEQALRILKYNSATKNFDDRTIFSPIMSQTGTEHPVVADVDGDGSAEIIVTGGHKTQVLSGQNRPPFLGSLYVLKSAGSKWAPARKVWNQTAYNAVNINNDLTIPKYQLNPATVFPGKDGVLGTVDDVRPYNGFLMQQTSLNKDGNPLWPAPDFVPQTGWSINTTATTSIISFCVKNTGDASGNSPLYVSVYKGDHTGTAVFTHQYAEVPAIGETKCYTLEIQNPSSYQTDQLIVVINDKGDATWQQPECEYDNNSIVVNLEGLPIARPDYITVMACDEVQFDYLTNDYRPAGTVVTSPTKVPKLGTFTTVGTDGKYTDTPPCNPRQLDTIGYKLCNGGLCSETNIVVNIRTRPQIVLQDSCSLQPRLVVDYQYQDMTYKWEYSVDNITWVTESSSTTTFLNVNKSGWYRVKLKHGTTEVLVSAVHFEVIKKSMLAGDIIWYESGLR